MYMGSSELSYKLKYEPLNGDTNVLNMNSLSTPSEEGKGENNSIVALKGGEGSSKGISSDTENHGIPVSADTTKGIDREFHALTEQLNFIFNETSTKEKCDAIASRVGHRYYQETIIGKKVVSEVMAEFIRIETLPDKEKIKH